MDLQLHTVVYVSLREKFKTRGFHGICSERVPLTAALYSLKGEPNVFFATLDYGSCNLSGAQRIGTFRDIDCNVNIITYS